MATVLVTLIGGPHDDAVHGSMPIDTPGSLLTAQPRVATFADAAGAAAAAVLLLETVTATRGRADLRAAFATGDPSRAAQEAALLLGKLESGAIALSHAAAEQLEGQLPDGMAVVALAHSGAASSAASASGSGSAYLLVPAGQVIAHRLPTAATSFVGRASELAELKTLLRDRPLLTLSGPPGSGKTRLAVELARRVLGAFTDGVWFVPLAPIIDPELVAASVASVLGLSEDSTLPTGDLVAHHLAGRKLMLVLDNFEHVLEAATAIPGWIAAAPQVRIVATSREALHLSAEFDYAVPPLSLPSATDDAGALQSEAVRLFRERAARGLPASLNESTVADIANICRRLDGLPLALELAAARTRVLSPSAILARLERSLDILDEAPRDAPDRHRSLRAAISWSHEQLPPAEQRCLRRLAAFKGGWELDAAEAVTQSGKDGDVLELITSLLDKSLVQRRLGTTSPRFEMLETLREYGLERLAEAGEAELTRRLHAQWFADLAARAKPHLTGPAQRSWLDRLELEHDNMRAALHWALTSGEVDLGLRLATALWRFWQVRGHIRQGREFLQQLLEQSDSADPTLRAAGLSAAGSLAYWQQDMPAACDFYQASLDLRRELHDPAQLAEGLYDLGWALTVPGTSTTDQARGRELGRQALELFSTIPHPAGEAKALWLLAWNAYAAGDSLNAVEQLGRSVDLFRALDDPFELAWALHLLGLAALRLERIQLAEDSWREALQIFADADDASGIDTLLDNMASLAVLRGQPERALRLAAAAARLGQKSGSRITDLVRQMEHRTLTGGRRLSEDAVRANWQAGESMMTAQAVAYALEGDAGSAVETRLHGLDVHALGQMRVERDGVPIRRWGGAKAGSRQAQAIFAFLFDRGQEGITKDEATELIWPDMPIQRADLAFHRTLLGLREVLEGGQAGLESITFSGGRYRLSPAVTSTSDVERLEERLAAAGQLEPGEAIAALEEARRLYRGDLFDDCPFYGDSSLVEERRAYLRGRYVDGLLLLAELYEQGGDVAAATARYRQALAADPASRRARDGIARLGKATGG